jgi:hypothetical protein
MTRTRAYGEDSDFGDYIRKQPGMDSRKLAVNDCDWMFQRYRTTVDSIGTREIQSIMWVEVKTRGAVPRKSQLETLSLFHEGALRASKSTWARGQKVIRHHGVSVLSFTGTSPLNSEVIWWGRFRSDDLMDIHWRQVTEAQMIGLLMFDLHSDNLTPQPYRRHHKTGVIEQLVTLPLGFNTHVKVETRS